MIIDNTTSKATNVANRPQLITRLLRRNRDQLVLDTNEPADSEIPIDERHCNNEDGKIHAEPVYNGREEPHFQGRAGKDLTNGVYAVPSAN